MSLGTPFSKNKEWSTLPAASPSNAWCPTKNSNRLHIGAGCVLQFPQHATLHDTNTSLFSRRERNAAQASRANRPKTNKRFSGQAAVGTEAAVWVTQHLTGAYPFLYLHSMPLLSQTVLNSRDASFDPKTRAKKAGQNRTNCEGQSGNATPTIPPQDEGQYTQERDLNRARPHNLDLGQAQNPPNYTVCQ